MFTFPPARYWLPNLFTLSSTFCGLVIIWLSGHATEPEQFYLAALLIPTACVLDGFDGRVARWVRGESAIGVQLDSMSDLVTFGVAPAFLLYYWALDGLGFSGLIVSFIFAAGSMLRLARFNVQAEIDHGVSRYFNGLPAPMAAMGVAALVTLDVQILQRQSMAETALWAVIGAVVLLALLMVSNLPFRTFKDMRRTRGNMLFVATVMSTLVVMTFRFDILSALSFIFAGYFFANLIFALVKRGWRVNSAGAPELDDDEEDALDDEFDRHI